MAQSRVLRGADIRVYVSGNEYPECQSLSWTIDYGEEPTYGIDSSFAQEISSDKISVQGTVSGVRIKLSGGLQGHELRARISYALSQPYTSLRVKCRHTGQDIFWLPQMKVTSESMQIVAKTTAKLSFTFKGIIPYNALDLS